MAKQAVSYLNGSVCREKTEAVSELVMVGSMSRTSSMVGLFFRDAASKYIYIQNQVSLGAGETVTAKRKCEEWLWEEARVAVKHYHSNNGVFKSEYFTQSCSNDGQTQSFRGVGAQHQNREAE